MRDVFLQAGFTITGAQERQFDLLLRLFMEKNAQLNLSAIRTPQEIIVKHFIDSLAALRCESFSRAQTVLDMGTGGGFPGLPLAIMAPDKSFTLLDATRKKVEAVHGFVHALGLRNVQTIWGRAEERKSHQVIESLSHRETSPLYTIYPIPYTVFDCVLTRAVAFLPDLLRFAASYMSPGGSLIAYKLPNEKERLDGLREAKSLGICLAEERSYRLPDRPQERVLLVFSRPYIGKKRGQ